MKRRIPEYFGESNNNKQLTVGNFTKRLFKQERNWTCSIACLRTILLAITDEVPSEEHFINTFDMTPGPYYSKDVKERKMVEGYQTIFSCDFDSKTINIDFIGNLLQEGYYIMVESMYNYAHWYAVLGYCAVGDETDLERHRMLIYDPYYNNVRLLNADEFYGMWCDPDNHIKELIAIKRK